MTNSSTNKNPIQPTYLDIAKFQVGDTQI